MTAARVHLGLTAAWLILLAPTLLWWRDSVFWVSLMSWYAIIVSHLAAYEAARAEKAAEEAARK